MARGEEKQFEITIDRLLEYTKNIKVSLLYFIQRIETESDKLEWPQVLDAFTSICGQINTLMRYTRENRLQFIENRVVLPLHLSPDRDEELAKLTENRVHVVDHNMVPSYLRTKPDPEIEEFDKVLQTRASTISPDVAVKQISATNKLIDGILNTIKTNSVRADTEMSRQAIRPSFDTHDTNSLVMAISTGRGLGMGTMIHRVVDAPILSQKSEQPPRQIPMPKLNVKAPELKTNIKTGP